MQWTEYEMRCVCMHQRAEKWRKKRPSMKQKTKWGQRHPDLISMTNCQKPPDRSRQSMKNENSEARQSRKNRRITKTSKVFQLTVLWLHLTLSRSSGKSVLSWPRLPLMDLASLSLLFFSSSIQRSSEHFLRCRWSPPPWPASTQRPVLSPPRTTETFPSPFASNSFLVLDWLASRPPLSVPFWVHS